MLIKRLDFAGVCELPLRIRVNILMKYPEQVKNVTILIFRKLHEFHFKLV